MPEIVVSEFMDEPVLARAFAGRDWLYDPGLVDRPAELMAALAGARALIVRNRTQVRGPLLDAAPELAVVGRLGVGLDNIDVPACEARGIAVCPATGANDAAVAEYVIAAMLALLRGAFGAREQMLAGTWPRMQLIGREVAGKTLGLIGLGAIARQTATRARALGLAIAAHDPFLDEGDPAWDGVARLDLDGLFAAADVLSLHLPLTAQTRNLVDARRLALMKPGAVLINAARGGIVDEAALAAALREGRLAGAALDVFAEEPLGAAAAAVFRELPNLILTPHIAGVTAESNLRVSEVTCAAVLRHLGG